MGKKSIGNITIDTIDTHNLLMEVRESELRGFKSVGPEVESAVRNAAPLGPTGNLKRGIGHDVSIRYISLNIFADGKVAPHHHLVEFGTVHSRANPYMRKTVESHKTQVFNAVAEELEKNG